MDLKKLQNGSDIRGVAMDGIPGEKVNLDLKIAEKIGRAFSSWLAKKTGKELYELKVAVGTDSRITGSSLREAISRGLNSGSVTVYNAGLASTPAMFMCTQFKNPQIDGGIMITASHLPFNRNGMKFFSNSGGLEKQDITAILEMAEKEVPVENTEQISFPDIPLMKTYSDHLKEIIRNEIGESDTPLKGFKIIIDAGNGSGGFFATEIIQPLGADIEGSLFLEPDGMFPNHIPNPENDQAMESITGAVKEHKADFGIIFDTDVDRAAFVDSYGNPIHRNKLIALISSIVLNKYPGSWIVTDSITSDGLNFFIEKELGGHHHRFKRGYRNVINEGIRLNTEGKECHLAIETSGHGAIKENYWLDDGAYLAALILVKLAKLRLENKGNISDLIRDLPEPEESEEYRFKIRENDFKEYGEKVLNGLKEFAEKTEGWSVVPDNYEGIRVKCNPATGNGWFLLRLSLHDPVMPINLESESKGGIQTMIAELRPFFNSFTMLDTSGLEYPPAQKLQRTK